MDNIRKIQRKRIIIFTLLILFCLFPIVISTSYINRGYPPPSYSKSFDPIFEKKQWSKYMSVVGAKNAYSDFKTIYNNAPYVRQHLAIHIMGDLIFQSVGVQGISICDDAMGYGCYHGFFSSSMKKYGLSKIHDMDNSCNKTLGNYAGGCQHGLGHGILIYLGTNRLLDALALCETLLPLDGCQGGVFMEYNFGNFLNDGQPQPRALDPSKPYLPCTDIPIKYQKSCYYAQVNWWESVYNKDYQKIGSLCESLRDVNLFSCYLGIGGIATKYSNFDVKKTLEKCDRIHSEKGNLFCKAGARTIYIIRKRKEKFDEICKSNNSFLQKKCVEISTLQVKNGVFSNSNLIDGINIP